MDPTSLPRLHPIGPADDIGVDGQQHHRGAIPPDTPGLLGQRKQFEIVVPSFVVTADRLIDEVGLHRVNRSLEMGEAMGVTDQCGECGGRSGNRELPAVLADPVDDDLLRQTLAFLKQQDPDRPSKGQHTDRKALLGRKHQAQCQTGQTPTGKGEDQTQQNHPGKAPAGIRECTSG